jgi:hypothetical protein
MTTGEIPKPENIPLSGMTPPIFTPGKETGSIAAHLRKCSRLRETTAQPDKMNFDEIGE